jgi:uncharacterized membrane protein YeaQ/YmgE (transglycosylase-associated protein family)
MGIILWIVFGALVGWVASLLMGTSGGLIADIVIGIVGSVIGGYAMSFFGKSGVGSFDLYSFLVALLGACVLLIIAKAVRG